MVTQLPSIIERVPVYEGMILSVQRIKIQVGEQIIEREVIERRNGVAVVPVDVDHNVLLIKEYTPGSNTFLYTLPGGHIDEGESPEIAAMRELREETGHRALQLIKLRYAYSHPAISTRKSYSFLGYDLTFDPLQGEDEDEDQRIEIHRLPLAEAIQRVYQDFISDMSTIGNLLMARDRLRELGL